MMTKKFFRVSFILMLHFAISLLLLTSFSIAEEGNKTPSAFSYSQEEGLKPFSKNANSTENPPQEAPSTETKEGELEKSPEEKTEEKPPENKLAEDFAPDTEESVEGDQPLDNFSENFSWFFEKKKSKHKIGIVPVYSHTKTQGSRLGVRFFSYSPDKEGYYLAFSGSKYLFRPFFRFDTSYVGTHRKDIRTKASFVYDNHYENYFGEGGMYSSLEDLEKLYAHRLFASYKLFYQPEKQNLYAGLGLQFFGRQERPGLQNNETYFKKEFFLFLKAFAGYDSRDNWRNPGKGSYHQISLGCKSVFALPGAYCRGELDFRSYVPLFEKTKWPWLQKSLLALRAFYGRSFFSEGTYSMKYSLAGHNPFQEFNPLRGFKHNRFRGDQMYVLQSEARIPIWKKYLQGVLFAELGEVADYREAFSGFVVDYGGGLRVGFPPDYNMKLRLDLGMGIDLDKKRNYNLIVNFLQAF